MNAEKGGGKDREGGFFMKKGRILIVGLIALLMACGLVLAGCNKDSDDGGGNNSDGGCPNRNCFYNNDNVWSFCNQKSCALAYDYDAKCDCK